MGAGSKDEIFRFLCDCGAALVAKTSQAGRKGKCKKCGRISDIPSLDDVVPLEAAPDDADAVQEVCSVCQTAIEDDDPRVVCGACGLPFHTECWRENLGCSAYGCENVNVLKQGPDITINQLPATPQTLSVPMSAPGASAASANMSDEIPWPYVLLGSSAIGCLLSIVMCGLPSLIVLFATAAYGQLKGFKKDPAIPIICFIVSGLGFLGGLVLSLAFWRS